LKYGTLISRVRLGWSAQEALTLPPCQTKSSRTGK
jgi:hypothetical protein